MDTPVDSRTHVDSGSRAWRLIWRGAYVLARRIGPFVRLLVTLDSPWYGDAIVELRLVGRRSGRPRPILVTLIRVEDAWYVGHPNGPRAWLANLSAADSVPVGLPRGGTINMRGRPLGLGEERNRVIRATPSQQPWPGSMLYWASQSHILRAGIYYRLKAADGADGAGANRAAAR